MKANGTRSQGVEWAGESVFDLPRVEPWPEAVDGAALLDELGGVLRRMVVLPQWAAEALVLWTVHTYAFELREVTTYVGIESPEKRCGKTTLLTLLGELVNRPVVASNISSPAFFRVTGQPITWCSPCSPPTGGADGAGPGGALVRGWRRWDLAPMPAATWRGRPDAPGCPGHGARPPGRLSCPRVGGPPRQARGRGRCRS